MTSHRALVALVLLAPLALPLFLAVPAAAGPTVTHEKIVSFDGTKIAITVFKPDGATAENPVPVIVRSHGWAGSRDKTIVTNGTVDKLLGAGYGVVTFDARGHGDSEGVARVHNPDYEIKDVSRILDFIAANLTWAQRDAVGDPRVGGSGGSYGGGWQLLTAALDGRMDALVPEITWNNLPNSLAPDRAVKSDWVHLLYLGGKARARLHPDIDAWYREGAVSNQFPQAAYDAFTYSSVSTHAGTIDVPTMLVQGVPDTLFNLNEAAANFDAIAANGAQVKLFTHLGGHLLSPGSVAGLAGQRVPADVPFPQPGDGGAPCGATIDAAIRWYDRHLKGAAVDTGPAVELAMDDGTCLRGASLAALATTETVAAADFLPVAGDAIVPLDTDATAIAGIPRVSFRYLNTCQPFTVYASLVAVSASGVRTLDAQVKPIRGPTLGEPCPLVTHLSRSVDLGGVGARVLAGETLALRLSAQDPQFATNGERWPQMLLLEDLVVELPVAV